MQLASSAVLSATSFPCKMGRTFSYKVRSFRLVSAWLTVWLFKVDFYLCGREIHLKLFKIPTSALRGLYFLVRFLLFSFLEHCTGSVHCAPDENDRPSEQPMLFLIFRFAELTKINA